MIPTARPSSPSASVIPARPRRQAPVAEIPDGEFAMDAMTLPPVIRPTASPSSPTAVPADESAIVLAASQGDRTAFEQLVHVHHQRVLNFIYQMTRQRQDAEDLTQQTFVKAFLHI